MTLDISQSRIAMIDDDPMHCQLYQLQFTMAGFPHFVVYQTAKEGLQSIFEVRHDLILLDIAMEEIDGITVLKRIKENKDIADVPVIMLSNMRRQDKGKEALELGAIDYFVKAEHLPHEVVEKVKNLLSK